MLEVSEVFASIQGEGTQMGRFATFVRLAGCNMVPPCPFCDTKYSLAPGTEMSNPTLMREILEDDLNPGCIVFTGGEPMLQAKGMTTFIDDYSELHFSLRYPQYALETNGTISPKSIVGWFDHVAVSPKLSVCDYSEEILNDWALLPTNVEFKFVVDKEGDLVQINKWVEKLALKDREIPVILQPNGLKQPYLNALGDLVEWVNESPLREHAQVLPQLHRVLWGSVRGK